MQIQLPVEVINEDCMLWRDLDIEIMGSTEVYSGEDIVARDFTAYCSHINLCKRLKKRFEKKQEEKKNE